MTKGINDFKYAIVFIELRRGLLSYTESGNPGHYNHNYQTAIDYLKNIKSVNEFVRYGRKKDLKKIKGKVGEALEDAVDFDEIVPEKCKASQTINKYIKTLEKVIERKAKKKDIKKTIEFFEKIQEGYDSFIGKCRFNPFKGVSAS